MIVKPRIQKRKFILKITVVSPTNYTWYYSFMLTNISLIYSLNLDMAFHVFVKSWLSRVFTKGVNLIKKKSDVAPD